MTDLITYLAPDGSLGIYISLAILLGAVAFIGWGFYLWLQPMPGLIARLKAIWEELG